MQKSVSTSPLIKFTAKVKTFKPRVRSIFNKSVAEIKLNPSSFAITPTHKPSKTAIFSVSNFNFPIQSSCYKLPILPQVPKKSIKIKKALRYIFKSNTNELNSTQIPKTIDLKYHSNKILYSHLTNTGSINGKPKPNNQDSLIAITNLYDTTSLHLFSVFDGHGQNGHHVSKLIQKMYLETLKNHIKNLISTPTEPQANLIFMSVINDLEKILKDSGISIEHSGTTFLSVILYESYCFCINIGDSRAIIGEFESVWTSKVLNKEHKPDDFLEKQRIEENGGRVGCLRNSQGKPIGPCRAWGLSSNSPGLAMSRTIGDSFAGSFGIISKPGMLYIDVKVFNLKKSDKLIVVATDGLWDVLNNEEVIYLASRFWENQNPEGAAQTLLNQAIKKSEKTGGYIDDITIIVVFRY
jgi:serine/threonine protein phosphatase PrpC